MLSKIITVLFAVNFISAANGLTDSKLRVLGEQFLQCYEENVDEFVGKKLIAARLNLYSEADEIKLLCLAMGVS